MELLSLKRPANENQDQFAKRRNEARIRDLDTQIAGLKSKEAQQTNDTTNVNNDLTAPWRRFPCHGGRDGAAREARAGAQHRQADLTRNQTKRAARARKPGF